MLSTSTSLPPSLRANENTILWLLLGGGKSGYGFGIWGTAHLYWGLLSSGSYAWGATVRATDFGFGELFTRTGSYCLGGYDWGATFRATDLGCGEPLTCTGGYCLVGATVGVQQFGLRILDLGNCSPALGATVWGDTIGVQHFGLRIWDLGNHSPARGGYCIGGLRLGCNSLGYGFRMWGSVHLHWELLSGGLRLGGLQFWLRILDLGTPSPVLEKI